MKIGKFHLILAASSLWLAQVTHGAPVGYLIQSDDLRFNNSGCEGPCAVGFQIGYTMGMHDGWAREIEGRMTVSLDPFVISEAEFIVPAASLTTGKIALRNKHMYETIGSAEYPVISFKLTAPIKMEDDYRLAPGDEVKVLANGVWTMHGISRDISIPMKVKAPKTSGASLLIRAKFELDNSAYGIKRYTYLGMTTEDISKIELNLPMRPTPDTP